MKTVKILHFSPIGSLKNIAEKLLEAITKTHPELEVKISPLFHANERKEVLEQGVSCDLVFVLIPAYEKKMPAELSKFLLKCEIKATFASVVCAYGRANPVLAIKKVKYYLRKKHVPTVSAFDIPVGCVSHESSAQLKEMQISDHIEFIESTLHNADVGKRIRIPLIEGKDKKFRYFV